MFTNTHSFKLIASAIAVSSILSNQSFANELADADVETLTVVGSLTNTLISPDELDMQQANDMADVFRQIPSVSVGGSLGIAQKVYIRGMEDTLLNVTVDGAQQTGTLFHHIGRVSIEPELLKQVEVQAGAGEATSGFGTIGGAIRFQTKNASDMLEQDQQFGGSIKGAYFSNDGEKLNVNLYGRINETWGVLASLVDVSRDNMQDGSGAEIVATAADQSLGFFKIDGEISDQQTLTLSYEHREESAELGQRPNWEVFEDYPVFPIDGKRQTFVANYAWALSDVVNLETTAYYTKSTFVQDVSTRWGEYEASTESTGFDIRNTSKLGSHTLTYGTELRLDNVQSRYLADEDVWTYWAWSADIGAFEEEGTVFGLYVQDHWQAHEDLLISYGLRYDSYDLEQVTYDNDTSSSAFSPNIGIEYKVSDNISLNVGHAYAMRGKEIGDAFTLEINPSSVSLAPDLKEETVTNTEAGLVYSNENLNLSATIYQTTIDDVIYDQLSGGTYYENIGEWESKGVELRALYQLDALTLSATYSTSDAEINGITVEGYEHVGLGNSRGDSLNIGFDYIINDSMDVGININHVASLNDIEVLQRAVELGWIDSTQTIDKDGYTVVDAYFKWLPNDMLTVNLGIQNLFDEHYRDHSSVGDYNDISGWEGVAGVYEAGRDLRASITVRF